MERRERYISVYISFLSLTKILKENKHSKEIFNLSEGMKSGPKDYKVFSITLPFLLKYLRDLLHLVGR